MGVAQAAELPKLPPPTQPIIAGALPYVAIPGAWATPDPKRTYKVVYDVTRPAHDPASLVEGVQMSATFVSALRGQGVAADHIKVALVFHGPSVDALLVDPAYRAKFGRDNPNLALLRGLKANGVEILLCGQYMLATGIDPHNLAPEVTVASEAFITLVTYQNDGYALLEF